MIRKTVIALSGIVFIILSFYVYHTFFTSKVGYVDIPKVFNGFEMKKEFQEKYKKTAVLRKRVIDSLSLDLQLLAKRVQANKKDLDLVNEFDMKREEFFKRKNNSDQDNAALSNQYDKQILEQMSQYILDFGKKYKYDIIMGADGNGTLMYANDRFNISEEVTNYINDRYKGVE
jgi:outer membrane protein